MKIHVDLAKCTGLGICESIAPGYFEIGDDGGLQVLRDDIDAADLADIEASVSGCPTEALWIVP